MKNTFRKDPFRKGSPVYQCRVCLKKTRDTGNDEGGTDLCRSCHDAALIENDHSDGNHEEPHEDCPACNLSDCPSCKLSMRAEDPKRPRRFTCGNRNCADFLKKANK